MLGDLRLDLARRKVERGGQSIELTPKEFLLLALLMRRLRVKVDDPFQTKMLRTVRGMGYVLEVSSA